MLNSTDAENEMKEEKLALLKYTYEQILSSQAEQVNGKIKIFDTIIDECGRKQILLNRKETAIATSKQDSIKEAFLNWI